jgi:predicted ATPase/DNA-binding NarL/FixJ family response regulator
VGEAARTWMTRFPDGIWWIDMTAVREAEMFERFVADQFGFRERADDQLMTGIATLLLDKRTLLVFDNCEHLVAACAELVTGLLNACRSVRVITTSREPLGIAGETVYPLPPLQPDEASRLFIERAAARNPEFEAFGQIRADVMTLCHRLDDLPLAVELAAARVSMMSPGEMVNHLNRRFELLTSSSRDIPERHRTLLAAVEWSYHLLDKGDQDLLSTLAVFSGSFDLSTAEAIAGSVALPGIARLIDKSLVVAMSTARGTRYRLLEAIRDYGLGRLEPAGKLVDVRDRLLGHFLKTVEAAYEERMSSGSDRLLLMLADDIDNLRGALEHAQATRPEDGMRLAGAMREEWVRRNPSEGRLWLQRLIPIYPRRDRHLGRALLAVGHIAMVQQDYTVASAALEESRNICSDVGDAAGEAWAIFFLGAAETLADERTSAQHHLEQALELQQRTSGSYGVLQARATMGQLLAINGERLEEGRRMLDEVLASAEKVGNRWSAGHAETFIGLTELRRRDSTAAEEHFRAAVREFTSVNDQVMLAAALCGLARALVRKDARRAATLASAAAEVHARRGTRFARVWADLLDETRSAAVARLGRTAAQEAWAQGQRLTITEAFEAAEGRAPSRPAGGLSRRELEVAELVAKGLSNRAMAERLHISERTVEGHVMHILNKLGLTNRTQVASWLHEKTRTG